MTTVIVGITLPLLRANLPLVVRGFNNASQCIMRLAGQNQGGVKGETSFVNNSSGFSENISLGQKYNQNCCKWEGEKRLFYF
jgi:hypothetical protein